METTIVYDTYIDSRTTEKNKNFGSSPVLSLQRLDTEQYAVIYWDINHEELIELKLKLKIVDFEITIRKWKVGGNYDTVYPANLSIKIDLYSLSSKVDEMSVTWDNAPKAELVKKDFITVGPGQNIEGQDIILDLTPYIDQIRNGIMLKINDYIISDYNSKYSGSPGEGYSSQELRRVFFGLNSSESTAPPILTYNYGEKPLSPAITKPIWGSIINKKDTSNIRFEWSSTGQTNYEFEYSQDNYNWTKLQGTTNKYVNVPTSGLNNGNLYARVRIKSGGMWSNYSQVWFLQVGEKPNTPVVSILAITTSTPIVSWNSNALQNKYQVQVLQGSQLIVDSGEVESKEYRYILKERLEDNKPYTFKVRIADENDIWSDWGTTTATIKFTKPAIPSFTLYLNPDRGFTLINIDKSVGGGESTIYNDIFRKNGNGEWKRIATNVIDSYSDYSIIATKDLHYKVRAIGQNGYNDSLAKSVYFKMRYNDLAIVGEWDKYIKLKYNERKKQHLGYSGEILKFAGRKGSVVEFDDNYDNSIALEFEITNKKELEMLQYIIDSRKTLLFRDRKGRKMYGSIISKLNIEDTRLRTYIVDFTFTETDFNEVV